ncbi:MULTISPECIES: hypothetical protein [unclassified Sphingobium]|uniref:hypothetical protein n=1 Tax=unclassified Sphingobium TaxID=2611147 RepID=UPI0005CBA709|nr:MULTISPECIES: hypothetical protein [unclassified Sphingobium]AJR24397.1 hypothetical protein TZ53_12330 [Sphingobium sp. YBL2]AMK16811.1 hypothetical protein K663_02100 [Sphingobium sp. MI1205]
MPLFERKFDVDALRNYRDVAVIKALFDRWVLPGEDAGPHGLRVAVRNGYLNFYVKGQSIAKLSISSGSPRFEVHDKYVAGVVKGHEDESKYAQKYTSFSLGHGTEIPMMEVTKWVHTAETYAGDEKRFVDDLVAVTAGTLDLEMALPARPDATGKVAPRMDLVVAQGHDIGFWEAKCAVNGELRSDHNKPAAPHVVVQLRKYVAWMDNDSGPSEVRSAYSEAARILLALAEMFGKTGPAIAAWQTFADAGDTASVILPPGVVVGNYCSPRANGVLRETEMERYRSHGASFVQNQHEARLKRFGIKVLPIGCKPATSCLCILVPGKIAEVEPRP